MNIGKRDTQTILLALHIAVLYETSVLDVFREPYSEPRKPGRGWAREWRNTERLLARFEALSKRLLSED